MGLVMDGVKLLVLGMVGVYVFLILMICMMYLLQKVLAPFAAREFEAAKQAAAAAKKASAASASDSDLEIAAAAAAFHANNQ
ncbi:MAG: OadG family protein [Lentisphaeria bacterium]|nr:OadG family protein [Lentisphaeria bacterium]